MNVLDDMVFSMSKSNLVAFRIPSELLEEFNRSVLASGGNKSAWLVDAVRMKIGQPGSRKILLIRGWVSWWSEWKKPLRRSLPESRTPHQSHVTKRQLSGSWPIPSGSNATDEALPGKRLIFPATQNCVVGWSFRYPQIEVFDKINKLR